MNIYHARCKAPFFGIYRFSIAATSVDKVKESIRNYLVQEHRPGFYTEEQLNKIIDEVSVQETGPLNDGDIVFFCEDNSDE